MNSTLATNDPPASSVAVGVAMDIVDAVISVMTLVTNGVLVLMFVCHSMVRRRVGCAHILNKALADVFSSVTYLTIVLVTHQNVPIGPGFCNLWYIIDFVFSSVSSASLFVTNLDVYLFLCGPLRYAHGMKFIYVIMMVALPWLLSVAIVVPLHAVGVEPLYIPQGLCVRYYKPSFLTALYMVEFYIPMIFIFVMLVIISMTMKCRREWSSYKKELCKLNPDTVAMITGYVTTLCVVDGLFLLMLMPFSCVHVFTTYHVNVARILHSVFLLNLAITPLVWMMCSDMRSQLNQCMMRICRCCGCTVDSTGVTVINPIVILTISKKCKSKESLIRLNPDDTGLGLSDANSHARSMSGRSYLHLESDTKTTVYVPLVRDTDQKINPGSPVE